MAGLKCDSPEDKDQPVFKLDGETYSCSRMCKKYIMDMFGEKTFVRLRESHVCEAKMMYGPVKTCFCDYKFSGEDPHAFHEA